MEEKNVRYKAFISYRHCEADKTIAKTLQRRLENYRIPKGLRKKLGRDAIGRIFRDEAELPVTDSLSDAIMEALRNSEYLIVICSPRLKLSDWCMKEIETFTKLHGRKKILPVLIEGEPEESFPESFYYEEVTGKDPDGKEVTLKRETEPLAADCRGGHKALEDTVIKLGAALLELNYDDLKQRHRAEQVKRRTVLSVIIFTVVLSFLVQTLIFLNTIWKQKKDIESKYAESCAQTSEDLLEKGNRMDALYAARSVLPDDPGEGVSADAFRALAAATQLYDRDIYVPKRMITAPVLMERSSFSPDGSYVLANNDSSYYLMDTAAGEVCYSFTSPDGEHAFYKNEALIYSNGSETRCHDIAGNTDRVLLDTASFIFSADEGEEVILLTDSTLYGYRGSERAYEIDLTSLGVKLSPEVYYAEAAFSEKEGCFLLKIDIYTEEAGSHYYVLQLDAESGKPEALLEDPFPDYVYDMCTDGKSITALTDVTEEPGKRLLCRYDIAKKKVVKSEDLGKETYTDLYPAGGRYVMLSSERVQICGGDLEKLEGFTIAMYPQEVLMIGGQGVVRNLIGELYSLEEENAGMELTERYFGKKEAQKLSTMEYRGGRFYLRYMGQDGIVVYEKAEELACTECEEPSSIPVWDGVDEEACREAFEALEGFDMYLYQNGTKSSDGKYYVVCLSDNSTCFYDARTMEKVKTIYGLAGFVYQFLYLEKYDCYAVVTSRLEIFDNKLEHTLTVEDVWEAYTDPADGELYGSGSMGKWYKIRIYSYRETLEYADKLLGDYIPSGRIREKYGL